MTSNQPFALSSDVASVIDESSDIRSLMINGTWSTRTSIMTTNKAVEEIIVVNYKKKRKRILWLFTIIFIITILIAFLSGVFNKWEDKFQMVFISDYKPWLTWIKTTKVQKLSNDITLTWMTREDDNMNVSSISFSATDRRIVREIKTISSKFYLKYNTNSDFVYYFWTEVPSDYGWWRVDVDIDMKYLCKLVDEIVSGWNKQPVEGAPRASSFKWIDQKDAIWSLEDIVNNATSNNHNEINMHVIVINPGEINDIITSWSSLQLNTKESPNNRLDNLNNKNTTINYPQYYYWQSMTESGKYLHWVFMWDSTDIIYNSYLCYTLNFNNSNSLYFYWRNRELIHSAHCSMKFNIDNNWYLHLKYKLSPEGSKNKTKLVYQIVNYFSQREFTEIPEKEFTSYIDILIKDSLFTEETRENIFTSKHYTHYTKTSIESYVKFNRTCNITEYKPKVSLTLNNLILVFQGNSYYYPNITLSNVSNIDQDDWIILNTSYNNRSYLTRYNKLLPMQSSPKNNIDYTTNISLLYSSNRTHVYYSPSHIPMPKVSVQISIISKYIRSTNIYSYFSHVLFFNTLHRNIKEKISFFIESGSTIETINDENGFSISISSFSDNIMQILDRIFLLFAKASTWFSYDEYLFNQTVSEDFNYLNDHSWNERGMMYFKRLVKYNKMYFFQKLSYKNEEIKNIYKTVAINSILTCLVYGHINQDELMYRLNEWYKTQFNISISANRSAVYKHWGYHHEYKGSFVFRLGNNSPKNKHHLLLNMFRIGYDYRDLRYLSSWKVIAEWIKGEVVTINNVWYIKYFKTSLEDDPIKMNNDFEESVVKARQEWHRLTDCASNISNYITINEGRRETMFEKSRTLWNDWLYNIAHPGNAEENRVNKENICDIYNDMFYENPNLISIQWYSTKMPDDVPLEGSEFYKLNPQIITTLSRNFNLFHN